MASIEQIIQHEANPFDPTTFRRNNFWQEQQDPALNVDSIHQEAIAEIESLLNQVAKDHLTRTIMLFGASGSGKSHLLGRVKRTLNPKAFFTYISSWPVSDFIWRHILRQTVDSLLKVPDGQQESQLLLWLKSLSVFNQRSFIDWLLGDRKVFIHNLKETYPSDIYNANEFFGVLYDLLNPELRPLACDWLRGDDLNEDDLKALKVKNAINNEDAAQKILTNFGRISVETQPIVLCFDNLDNIPHLPDGFLDLQALFNVNSTIHTQSLKNFLVIISIVTDTWKRNKNRVQPADLAKIDAAISLKPITLNQSEALWKFRLTPLHRQADIQPDSCIFPLKRQALDEKFPGGKTWPRNTLVLGRQMFQEYKIGDPPDTLDDKVVIDPPDTLAFFQLVWSQELSKVQRKVTRIRQFSSAELIRMLQEALSALQLGSIQLKLLPSPTYAACSFSYQPPGKSGRSGVVWIEEPNMTTFYNVMRACQTTVQKNLCETLYLIRSEGVGKQGTKGNKIYTEIFTNSKHHRIEPELSSVHYLATYHSLVNAACAGELIVREKIVNLPELEALIRTSGMMRECTLFKELGIFPNDKKGKDNEDDNKKLKPVKEFLLNLVETNQFLGRKTLIDHAKKQFSQVTNLQAEQLIQQLCQENKIQILDPEAKPEAQLICFVPKTSLVKK